MPLFDIPAGVENIKIYDPEKIFETGQYHFKVLSISEQKTTKDGGNKYHTVTMDVKPVKATTTDMYKHTVYLDADSLSRPAGLLAFERACGKTPSADLSSEEFLDAEGFCWMKTSPRRQQTEDGIWHDTGEVQSRIQKFCF